MPPFDMKPLCTLNVGVNYVVSILTLYVKGLLQSLLMYTL